jgi:hypothetical protein
MKILMNWAISKQPVKLIASLVCGAFCCQAQQASLTLESGDMMAAHWSDTSWSLQKTADQGEITGSGSVVWTVTATKGETSSRFLTFGGWLRISNSGSAPATIGNIVVNLQRKSGKSWKTISSDIADATLGGDATTALVVSGASSEGLSSFTENAGSGNLKFTDAANNTIFSLVPGKALAPAERVDLVYLADFNNTVLGIPEGESVRLEVIVTFGNSGARGGSGASAKNIDINGNGLLDQDESYVRSVPCRITRSIPLLEQVNGTVELTDPEIHLGGGANAQNITSTISTGATLTSSQEHKVSSDLSAIDSSGYACNTAYLKGNGGQMAVIVGVSTITNTDGTTAQSPVYRIYEYCAPVNLSAESCVTLNKESMTNELKPGTQGLFTTYTQGGWGATPHGSNPAALLAEHFSTVYADGSVEVGIPGASGYSMKFCTATTVVHKTANNAASIPAGAYNIINHGAGSNPRYEYDLKTVKTAASALGDYLPAGGTAQSLTADLVNPTSASAGVFGGQVLALQLNIDFSLAGITQGTGGMVGDLHLFGTGTSLDGLTIKQVLAVCNIVLGGGPVPADTSVSTLNGIATQLNQAFDNGIVSEWAGEHLKYP